MTEVFEARIAAGGAARSRRSNRACLSSRSSGAASNEVGAVERRLEAGGELDGAGGGRILAERAQVGLDAVGDAAQHVVDRVVHDD